jgi:hypothetical protein
MLSWLMRRAGGRPAFRIYGKGQAESTWHEIDVFANQRRNATSRWPFFGATCITWSGTVIAVGWDFAESVLREQMVEPASREHPVEVGGGRLHSDRFGTQSSSAPLAWRLISDSEILAHECGHTAQARRFGPIYLIIGAIFTWWREGRHWWNWFENQASAVGQFGGIVSESVHPGLWAMVKNEKTDEQ